MKKLLNKMRERVNLWIGGVLATLGIGATGCDLLSDFRFVGNEPVLIPEDSVDIIVCKYGVPPDVEDSIIDKPKPQDPDSGEIICMYGVPSAKFQIKGTVTDSVTGQPLNRIQVNIDTRDMQTDVITDQDGNYQMQTDWMFPTDSVFLTFSDPSNQYQDKKIGERIEYKNGDNAWDMGEADMQVDAKLAPQKDNQ